MHLTKEKYNKWQKFQNSQNKKTKKQKVVFGKNLPVLSSYPKTVPDVSIYEEFFN